MVAHPHGIAPGLAAPNAAASCHPPGLEPLGAAGAPLGGLNGATNDEAPAVTSGQGFRKQKTTANTPDFTGHGITEQVGKALATLRAKLALAGGYQLHELTDGSFLVSRWNLTRPLPDLRAVAAFARQVGAV